MAKKTIYSVMYSNQHHDGMVFTYGTYDTELNALRELPRIIQLISYNAYQAEVLGRKLDYFYSEKEELENDEADHKEMIEEFCIIIEDLKSELESINDYVGFDAAIDDIWVKPMDFYYDDITNPLK
jgi:hypothetical protein